MRSMSPTPAACGEIGHGASRKRIELSITQAGNRALSFMENSTAGRVLHVFDNSAYLENESGGLACLGGPAIGAAPLNAVAAFGGESQRGGFPAWRLLLEEGDPVSFQGKKILVGNNLALGFHEARRWRPEFPSLPIRTRLLAVHLEALRHACSANAPHQSLGFLLARQTSPATPPLREVEQVLAARAGMALTALEGWLQRSLGLLDPPAANPLAADEFAPPPPGEAAGMIGLGPGLTPSGDDLIGGMAIALHSIGRAGLAHVLGRWAVPLARTRSTRISMAHLSAACDGEGAAALHEVLIGLGRDPHWAPRVSLNDPFFQGHTSGWDALAGILLVMSNLPAGADPRRAA